MTSCNTLDKNLLYVLFRCNIHTQKTLPRDLHLSPKHYSSQYLSIGCSFTSNSLWLSTALFYVQSLSDQVYLFLPLLRGLVPLHLRVER